MGKFLQTDPIGSDDGPNLYAYLHGDPVNATDPSGLDDNRDDGSPLTVERVIVGGQSAIQIRDQYGTSTITDPAQIAQIYQMMGGVSYLPLTQDNYDSSSDIPPLLQQVSAVSTMFDVQCKANPAGCAQLKANISNLIGGKFSSEEQNKIMRDILEKSSLTSVPALMKQPPTIVDGKLYITPAAARAISSTLSKLPDTDLNHEFVADYNSRIGSKIIILQGQRSR
jgi:hypothetical protein